MSSRAQRCRDAAEAEARYSRICSLDRVDRAELDRLLRAGGAAMIPWLAAAAARGEARAQALLAQSLLDGAGVPADPRRAFALLGWQPRRSDLDSIIGDAWAWHSATVEAGRVAENIIRMK